MGKIQFYGRNVVPRLQLHVLPNPPTTPTPRHSVIILRLEIGGTEELERFCEFAYSVSAAFEADYSVAHMFTESELEHWLNAIPPGPQAWPSPPGEVTVARLRANRPRGVCLGVRKFGVCQNEYRSTQTGSCRALVADRIWTPLPGSFWSRKTVGNICFPSR
jgi:hypothetical protein